MSKVKKVRIDVLHSKYILIYRTEVEDKLNVVACAMTDAVI